MLLKREVMRKCDSMLLKREVVRVCESMLLKRGVVRVCESMLLKRTFGPAGQRLTKGCCRVEGIYRRVVPGQPVMLRG
jgi:hypothetical protein